jgi:hypothetical protein
VQAVHLLVRLVHLALHLFLVLFLQLAVVVAEVEMQVLRALLGGLEEEVVVLAQTLIMALLAFLGKETQDNRERLFQVVHLVVVEAVLEQQVLLLPPLRLVMVVRVLRHQLAVL